MNQPPHGGPREGAGRKPDGDEPKETTSISIDRAVLAAAREHAKAHGISLSRLIEDRLREYLGGRPAASEEGR